MTESSQTLTGSVVRPALPVLAYGFGARAIEFCVTGGGTLLVFPLLVALRALVGLDAAELAVGFTMFHAAHLINDPHFAVTYLLFYRDAKQSWSKIGTAQRARYVFAGAVVPAALGIACAVALATKSAPLLGLLIQLMFLLVGWHYVKQGFGVLNVLAARRGVRFEPLERKVILAHCLLGWAYAWASPAEPGRLLEEKGVVYRAIAHGVLLERVTLALFAASAVGLVVVLVRKWRREGALPVTPLVGLLVSVWIWSVYSSADPLLVYVIPALHSLQYLYFVWLLKRNEARAAEVAQPFGPSVKERLRVLALSALGLGFLLFHALPEILDGALSDRRALTDLGATPYFAAIFAFVNIHHYFMDTVIWRRENPSSRYLLEDSPRHGAAVVASS
jgi:hypothetical protein